jgi:hypothetical protein
MNMQKNIQKILVLSIITLFFLINLNSELKAQCEETGQNCDFWHQGSETTYEDAINFPGCVIHVAYDYMICEGVTYYRLRGIYFDDSYACDAFKNALMPYGWNGWTDGNLVATIWRASFLKLSEEYLINVHTLDPTKYNCPAEFTAKTITPGGCSSTYVGRRHLIGVEGYTYRIMHAPCELGACCVTTKVMCYNNGIVTILSQTTQYTSGSCVGKLPLYNPFDGYVGWDVSAPGPCVPSCFIDPN